jgi:hypothetical protein
LYTSLDISYQLFMAFNQCKLNLRWKYRHNTHHLLILYRTMTVVDLLYEYYSGHCILSGVYLYTYSPYRAAFVFC